jgi:hypothetical protein
VDGREVVSIRKATVEIHIDASGAMGMDKDIAVMCVWDEYVTLNIGADYCFADSERELKEDFADAVERFKDFIVANSLTPVTRGELDAYVAEKRATLAVRGPKTATGAPHCTKLDFFAPPTRPTAVGSGGPTSRVSSPCRGHRSGTPACSPGAASDDADAIGIEPIHGRLNSRGLPAR